MSKVQKILIGLIVLGGLAWWYLRRSAAAPAAPEPEARTMTTSIGQDVLDSLLGGGAPNIVPQAKAPEIVSKLIALVTPPAKTDKEVVKAAQNNVVKFSSLTGDPGPLYGTN